MKEVAGEFKILDALIEGRLPVALLQIKRRQLIKQLSAMPLQLLQDCDL